MEEMGVISGADVLRHFAQTLKVCVFFFPIKCIRLGSRASLVSGIELCFITVTQLHMCICKNYNLQINICKSEISIILDS